MGGWWSGRPCTRGARISPFLGRQAGLSCEFGRNVVGGGLLSFLFLSSLLYLRVSGIDPKGRLLWGEVRGPRGSGSSSQKGCPSRQQVVRISHVQKIWPRPSCVLSSGESEEGVTGSVVTAALAVSSSGVLVSIRVLFHMVRSRHPLCVMSSCFLFILLFGSYKQDGLRVNI